MKRKRGSGKRKPKKPSVTGTAEASIDPGYYSDINEENDGFISRMETEARKVNTNTSGQHVDLDKPVVNNESVGSAAAKLARVISSSCTKAMSAGVPLQGERTGGKEPKSSFRDPLYKEHELDASLSVINKIMKMDEAVPFNVPVDPIALGIPDYFDIIDTPMDFEKIQRRLENGLKYMKADDVLKDVQYIWDNCCKYNKKGSHILGLMKRVKNNFIKLWTAAGLYKEQQNVSNGHLQLNPQLFAELTMRHREAVHTHPLGSTISSSAYLQQHDQTCLNQRQDQQIKPCCCNTCKPQQMSYQSRSLLHSLQSQPFHHQNNLSPQHDHYMHLRPLDLLNGISCNQLVNEASPSLVHSCQPSPNCSLIGHPLQRTCSQLQTGINSQIAGLSHLHTQRESTLTLNKCEHACNSGQIPGDANRQQQYLQMDSVHIQGCHPLASCTPAHQLNQSTCHKFQNSHIEAGGSIDCPGNLHMPPPTESTANCTKRGTECQRGPVIDNTSCRPPDQINATLEQSSSTINIEACQPHEKTFQNLPGSTPSERLHSHADNNFSKRKPQGQGLVQCREQSSSMMNCQKSQPQENSCQNQTGCHQSRPSPPSDYNTISKRKSRGRGPTRCLKLLREGQRISITTNDLGQPVGPLVPKLVTFLGTLARNGHFFPLTYLDWRAVPYENKENMWQKVQLTFEIDPMSKDWVLQSLSKKWKAWKSKLKTAHYDPHETDEERLADCDERVLPDQWAALIALWNTETAQKRCATNRANRLQQKYGHATGTKSFARIREEQRVNRPDGKAPSRAELFILTRTRKNGKPINEASSAVITQLQNQAKCQDTPHDSNDEVDILSQIVGHGKKGNIRCLELGSSLSDLGMQKPTRAEAIKMVSEANVEIHEVKEKMAVMEQTCAQMASQMAAMMSMMSSMHKYLPDKNLPNMVCHTSGTSDHSLPQQVDTRPSPCAGSSLQTRRRSKRNI